MSAPVRDDRYFERSGSSVRLNDVGLGRESLFVDVYVCQSDQQRDEWSVLFSTSHAGFHFQGHMSPAAARALAQRLNGAADMLELQQAAWQASQQPVQEGAAS